MHPFSGATSGDMIDFVKPLLRRNPDKFILHVGTNDLTQNTDINTHENLQQIVNIIKTTLPKCEIILSQCIIRTDKRGIEDKVKELQSVISNFCVEKNYLLIKHPSINVSCLAKRKLHLNVRGKSILERDFKKILISN